MTYNSSYTGPQIDSAARLASIIFDDLPAMLADARDYTAHTAGDVFWTATEGFRYEVAASGATDHHLTTAGGVKVYVQPSDDGIYNFGAFNPAADGVTDDYDVLMTAIYKTAKAKIYFPPATYAISQTVHFKKNVHFIGDKSSKSYNSMAGPTFKFPSGVRGFWVERKDTFNGRPLEFHATLASLQATSRTYATIAVGARIHITGDNTAYEVLPSDAVSWDVLTTSGLKLDEIDVALLGPDPDGNGHNSTFEALNLDGTSPDNPNTDAHGIHSQAGFVLLRCEVFNFSGDGVHIFAATDRRVSGPGETYGEASGTRIEYLTVNNNQGCGFFNQGYDAQAGTFIHIDAVGNGRWGIWEKGFLGNTHIGHHLAFNGVAYAGRLGSAGKSAVVTHSEAVYYAHKDATEQQLVDTTPGTNSAIWVPGTWIVSGSQMPAWQASQPVGTYYPGGSMIVEGASARNLILYCYTEGSQGPTWVNSQSSIVMGGIMGAGFAQGGQIRGYQSGLDAAQFRAAQLPNESEGGGDAIAGLITQLGGGSNAILAATGLDGSGTYRLRSGNGQDWRWDYNNGNSLTAFTITGNTTAETFGTSAAIPHQFFVPAIAMGGPGLRRRQTTGTAAPTTGNWARGDIVWNVNAAAAGWAGWICTAAGTPGTWKRFGAIEA